MSDCLIEALGKHIESNLINAGDTEKKFVRIKDNQSNQELILYYLDEHEILCIKGDKTIINVDGIKNLDWIAKCADAIIFVKNTCSKKTSLIVCEMKNGKNSAGAQRQIVASEVLSYYMIEALKREYPNSKFSIDQTYKVIVRAGARGATGVPKPRKDGDYFYLDGARVLNIKSLLAG